jgi:DNA topoisomerase I
VLAARALRELPSDTATEAKKNLLQAIEAVAGLLGNTKSVCRKCYIHPAIIDAYLDRSLLDTLEQRAEAAIAESDDLKSDEVSVLKFLRKRLEKERAA